MATHEPPSIQPGPLPSATTVEEVPRHLRMHRVTDQELTVLASVKSGIHIAFFGVTFGCFVAFWIVLRTVTAMSGSDHTLFLVLTFVSALLAAFFGLMAIVELQSMRRLASDIRGKDDPEG
jgi:hypothetical protein